MIGRQRALTVNFHVREIRELDKDRGGGGQPVVAVNFPRGVS